MSEKGYVTANDLQKWIDHLTEEEKDLPIVVSESMFPEETEILELSSIGHFLSHHFRGYVICVKKNYKAIIGEMFDDK